jgi:tetratricopeptide (TPR) repeat protein
MRVLHNKPVQLKQPAHKAMETVIAAKGTAEAVKTYQVYKKDTANYYIDWLAMDQLGNQLFADKRYNDALLIFENNAREFPQRDLVLISLAKTYEVLGRKTDAILWYQKILVLNPKYEEARNRLKEMEKNK